MHKFKSRDPFGRLPEPEQKERFDLSNIFNLTKPVGAGVRNDRANVAKIETLLALAGVLDLNETDGLTGYAGQRMVDGIRSFQKRNKLAVDGVLNPGGPTLKALAQSLQGMGRNGDTVLAHLSPEEARALHEGTDGGSINPRTGLLEFFDHHPGTGSDLDAFGGPGPDISTGRGKGISADTSTGISARGHSGWDRNDPPALDAENANRQKVRSLLDAAYAFEDRRATNQKRVMANKRKRDGTESMVRGIAITSLIDNLIGIFSTVARIPGPTLGTIGIQRQIDLLKLGRKKPGA